MSKNCPHLAEFLNPHCYSHEQLTNINRHLLEKYKDIGKMFPVKTTSGHLLSLICAKNSFDERISVLERHLSEHVCRPIVTNPNDKSTNSDSSHASSAERTEIKTFCPHGSMRCPALYLFGHFLKSFTYGWPETDLKRVFHTLVHQCFGENFWFRLTSLICQSPGKDADLELSLRLFMRRLFLDPVALPQPPSSGSSRCRYSAQSSNTSNCAQLDSTIRINGNNSNALSDFKEYLPCPNTNSTLNNESCSSTSFTSFNHPDLGKSANAEVHGDISRYENEAPSSQFPTSAPIVIRSSSLPNMSHIWPAARSLKFLLDRYPYVHQARLLFILYGPMHKGRLMWRTMCENTAADSDQLSACFGELGSVFNHLLESRFWTENEAVSILDEVTAVPEEWLAENVACLLYTSGPKIAQLSIRNKAFEGKITELAVTLTSLCLVQVKIRADLTELIRLVGEACRVIKERDRTGFLDQLARSFQDVIVDLYETDELEERIEDFSTILRAQAEFMRALMAHVYEE